MEFMSLPQAQPIRCRPGRRFITSLLLTLLAMGAAFAPAAESPTAALVRGNTAFALDLYQRERTNAGNLFFSPYSISTALAMTYAGARGQTAQEMARVLHFTLPQDEVPAAFAALGKRMAEIGGGKQVTLNVANSLWAQRRYQFAQPFLDLNRKYFGAEVGLVDFEKQPSAACRQINAWVAQKTAHKIEELISPDMANEQTRLILCNAVYFKGDWAQPFDPRDTSEADFFLSPGRSVRVPLMFQEMRLAGDRFDGVGVFALRYKGGDLSMIILLPNTLDGLAMLEHRLGSASLAKWLSRLDESKGTVSQVFLPRFKMSSRFDLSQTLSGMGMPAAFREETADFSGITDRKGLFISAVAHEAVVEVNEQGTEAAAATAVLDAEGYLPRKPVFRADHPFVFLIRENRTGAILFLGRVVDPTN